MAGSWSGPSVSSLSRCYMNPAGCEGFPTSTLIMPFFNMFKSRRARSTSLPRAPERYLHESEVYNQASAYGPRSTSGFGRSVHPAPQPRAGFRAQRYPSHASSFSNSVPERYAESPTNDQVRTTACRISHPQCHEHLYFHNNNPPHTV